MLTLDYLRSVIVLGLIIGQPMLWAWILWLERPIDMAGAFGLVVAVGAVSTCCARGWPAWSTRGAPRRRKSGQITGDVH